MRHLSYLALLLLLLGYACHPVHEELTPQEQHVQDSLAMLSQKHKIDSLKKKNPLLIVPPDSTYTGDYIDKYPNGVIKFKGYFRLGARHGQWLSFYPGGTPWSEMHYDKGLRNGPNITYFEDGKTRYTGFYKNDLRDSLWLFYDSTGKVAQKLVFKKDRIVKELPLK